MKNKIDFIEIDRTLIRVERKVVYSILKKTNDILLLEDDTHKLNEIINLCFILKQKANDVNNLCTKVSYYKDELSIEDLRKIKDMSLDEEMEFIEVVNKETLFSKMSNDLTEKLERTTNELDRLETLKRNGLLTNKKDDSYNNDRALESSKVIREAIDLNKQIFAIIKMPRSPEKLRDLIQGKYIISLMKSDLIKELEKGRIPEFHKEGINKLIETINEILSKIEPDIELMKDYKDLGVLDEDEEVDNFQDVYENKKFKTNLSDTKRLELCNRIISNKGAENKNDKTIFKDIEEKHIPTLLYILGGEYPEKIERIKVFSIGRTHEFLKSISEHPHPYLENEICVPDFLKYVLLKSNGDDIPKLKK